MFVRRNGFLPFPRPSIGREEIDEVVDTLRSGWITTGLKTQRLEGAFGVYVGCRHAVALSSARGALHTGLTATRSGLTSFTLIMPKIRTRKRITNIQK